MTSNADHLAKYLALAPGIPDSTPIQSGLPARCSLTFGDLRALCEAADQLAKVMGERDALQNDLDRIHLQDHPARIAELEAEVKRQTVWVEHWKRMHETVASAVERQGARADAAEARNKRLVEAITTIKVATDCRASGKIRGVNDFARALLQESQDV